MSSELERRLEGLLAEAPEPDPGAEEKALHRALQAVQPAVPARHGRRAAVFVFAAAVVLLVIAAGSLAAVGALHVSLGTKPKPKPRPTPLVLPKGANGIAAIVDGELSVATQTGLGLQGRPVSAAALSPHALYVAGGIGNSLVAMAPDGRTAFSHPAGGKVVAIAWAPDGYEIAFVVHAGRKFALHVIYGNGIRDTTIDRSVRAVRPSWRGDSLALAYVGAGGKAIVYDVGHLRRDVTAVPSPVTGVAFAPRGGALAVARDDGVWLVRDSRTKAVARGTVEAFGWLRGRLAVATPGLDSAKLRSFSRSGAPRGSSDVHGIVVAVTPKLVVVRKGRTLVGGHTPLLTTGRGATVRGLQIG
jgi:hypothetical protein